MPTDDEKDHDKKVKAHLEFAATLTPREANQLLLKLVPALYNTKTKDSPQTDPKVCEYMNFICQQDRGSQITLRGPGGQVDFMFNKDGE